MDFNTGNLRQDLIAGIAWRGIDEPSTPNGDAGSGPRVLDNITIQSTGFCKKFKLYTSYFYDPQALTGQIVTAYPNLNLTTDKYRLKLDQLQESSCDNSVAIPPYYFNYFSETVPRKLSFGIDHWGFYNGMTSNSSLIPTYSIPDPSTGNPVLNPGASRDAQWPAMRAGALQKITYPTGGSTVFDFEPNSVFTSNTSYGQRFIVGLSIHQTQYGQATSFSQTQPLPSASGQYEIVASNGSAFDSHLIITADANGATVQDIILRANTSYYNLITLPTASYHVNISLTQNGGISYAGGVQANFYQWQTTTTQQNVTVGGLRIKSITNNDAVTGTPVVTSYNYNFDNDNTSAQHSSGLLFSQPVYVQALRMMRGDLCLVLHAVR